MANWQRHLKLNPEWDQANDGVLSLQELAGVIAKRLHALTPFESPFIDGDREELASRFEGIATDADADQDEFNDAMTELYDWGDTRMDERWNSKKVCWIDTHSVETASATT